MNDGTKHIKMGPHSPNLGLPEPVQWDEHRQQRGHRHHHDDDDDDDSTFRSSLTNHSPLSLSDDDEDGGTSVVAQTVLDHEEEKEDRSVVVMMPIKQEQKETAQQRCNCVEEIKRILGQQIAKDAKKKDDETVCSTQSDLDSNAFYWACSPDLMKHDYSLLLDKSVERRSPRLYEHLQHLRVDDEAVLIAVKELVTSDERVSQILKRMHERLRCKRRLSTPSASASTSASASASASASTTPIMTTKPSCALDILVKAKFHSANVADVKDVASQGKGYLWKNGELLAYEPTPDVEYLRADMEYAKFGVLQGLLEPHVLRQDQEYKALRQAFREVVANPEISEISEGDAVPVLPVQWLTKHLGLDPVPAAARFNVSSFVKESKLGQLEKIPQVFRASKKNNVAFLSMLDQFVKPREIAFRQISRQSTFDLKRTDDVLRRFLKHTDKVSFILPCLSVFLAKPCALLRIYINYAYPSLAMWLHLIEHFEHHDDRRVLSPFFPPASQDALETQLTDLGFMDDVIYKYVHVYDPVPERVVVPVSLPSPSSSPPRPLPSPSRPLPAPSIHMYSLASPRVTNDADDDELRFSTIFLNLFSRKS